MKNRASDRRPAPPDMEETKVHVLAAGRELLLAASGALRFCKEYAESSASPGARHELALFFSKAIAVADELGKGLISASSVTRTARSFAKPLFDAMGREMYEERAEKPEAAPAPRKKAGRRPVRAAVRPKARAARRKGRA